MKYILLVLMLMQTLGQVQAADSALPPKPAANNGDGEVTVIVAFREKAGRRLMEKELAKYQSVKIRRQYKYAIDGFSAVGSSRDIARLKKDKNIFSVTEVKSYKAELEDSVPFIGAGEARSFFDSKNRRITGKGVVVGIIDTGVDYEHPDLQKSYRGGKDLVDGDDDPMETKGHPSLATSHGTHVAGIVAANGRMKGVAPEAEIRAYRALGPGGTGDTEQVLAAIDAAIEDKVDVMNLSLGNEVNGPDLPISLALNKAADLGIIAVTSSGNAGPDVWSVGSPGTAEKAISVGASTPPLQNLYIEWGLGSVKKQERLMPLQGSAAWGNIFSGRLADGGVGTPEELRGVKGHIALIKRGGDPFSVKVRNAAKAGAEGVIIYNNMEGSFTGAIEEGAGIPAVSMSGDAGRALTQWMAHRKTVLADFIYRKEQDLLADFSSRGPVTVTWAIKPDILAPGVAINSTIPSGYESMQGTSMAAPHVAGAAALILQAHPDWSPADVKSALMSTAKPLVNEQGALYRTYEQGAGRLRIEEALRADTLLAPGSLTFGMYEKSGGIEDHKRTIKIRNTAKEAKRYTFDIPRAERGLVWRVPRSVTIGPGQTKELTVSLQAAPSRLKKGIYDGYLTLREDALKLQIPFLYVKEEPDYPRVMGFEFGPGETAGQYRYEMYLPGGADEYGVALYDPDTFRFIGYLDRNRHAPGGMVKKEISAAALPPAGVYHAVIYARKAGKEDQIDTEIQIEQH